MIKRKYFEYNFDNLVISPWNKNTFAVVFSSRIKDLPTTIVDNLNGFKVTTRVASLADTERVQGIRNNYFFEKNSCLVLEASGVFAQEDEPYVIGFPVYLVGEEDSIHQFAITYDGVWFNIFCDGILYDRDSPHGGALLNDTIPQVKAAFEVDISGSIEGIINKEKFEEVDTPIYCYTPKGFNTWIGDVTLCSYNDALHLFYLYDRHHHGSRKGRGAHTFCHLVTNNLVDWVDYGEVVSFDKPYLTVGTGNAFVLNNQLHLAFGWHTRRSKPKEECAGFLLQNQFAQSNKVKSITYEELGDIYPGGASYATSSNGIDFTYSNKIIHYVENPNITLLEDGSLRLCEHGVWKGKNLDSWILVDESFPPKLQKSSCLNTTECPCFFTLGNREFLMIGFSGFYEVKKDGSLVDLAKENLDVYDGMAVPMAKKYQDTVIAAAWMNTRYWGSFLLLRELFLLENGNVGSRWIKETLPKGDFAILKKNSTSTLLPQQVDSKYQLEFQDRIELKFSGSGNDCYLVIDTKEKYAAFLSNLNEKIEFFSDIVKRNKEAESFRNLAGEPIHVWGKNYARKLDLGNDVILLKLIIHNENKFHGAFIDVEIDSKYTFATYRDDLKAISSVTFN
jgi:sucrose-6-phosphate hydrolase SacC (GH32 family)